MTDKIESIEEWYDAWDMQCSLFRRAYAKGRPNSSLYSIVARQITLVNNRPRGIGNDYLENNTYQHPSNISD